MIGCLLSRNETLSVAPSNEKKKKKLAQATTTREMGSPGEKRQVCVGIRGCPQAREAPLEDGHEAS